MVLSNGFNRSGSVFPAEIGGGILWEIIGMVAKHTPVYVPTDGPEGWRQFLADPIKQWKNGCSAKELAYSWESAEGFPFEIAATLNSHPAFDSLEILFAVPEYKVPLPGGGRASQSDLFVLARHAAGLVVIMVEGKASESFGPTLGEWRAEGSSGKVSRLAYLQSVLRLNGGLSDSVRYQLLHRAASALIVAERFHAASAIMLVHSFSVDNKWFDDYASFLNLYGVTAEIGVLHKLLEDPQPHLFCGWVKGIPVAR